MNEMRLRAMIAALRGDAPEEINPNVEDLRSLPEMPGRPFMPYVPGQDHTARFTEPKTYGEATGLDPVPRSMPYVDPVADWWYENPEALDEYLNKQGYTTRSH